ncbi:MAG: aldehyde ferredoxin oxidoreductase family protein [Anaerolineae bacterium]|nr:aldehyde ferredoxin oxidoreductase family protein [Anaerolineae bacterium]
MYGWSGKIVRVDLTRETATIEDVDPHVARDFIGGRGWAIKYLYDEVDPTVDPLAPENMLIFGNGPLTATPAPTGNRYTVVTKSPLTGALACSNSGGFFPTEMKRAGFDLFIFEGRASRPVYLWVQNGQVEIRPAAHLWGKDVHETTDLLLAETDPKARVACIGPAGERLVKVAAIMNDKHRAAARSGVGAVMGSKNLKAVVVRGTGQVPLAHPQEMKTLSRQVYDEVGESVKKGNSLREYGTAYVPPVTNEMGILPTHNFQTGRFAGVGHIDGPTLKEKYLIRAKPCYACPIACGRDTEVDDPDYAGKGEGPEYETIAAFGSACGIDNLAAVTKANYLCNELGLDTISMGVTLACAMEMFEKGILPEGDVGRPLPFGDAGAVIQLVHDTAYRHGFGDKLAEGSYRLASAYGHPELSMTARKLEMPGYDPRGAKGMGLLYATSNIGASHMAGDLAYAEVFGVPAKIDPLDPDPKPALIHRWEDAFAVIDAAGLCVFLSVRYLFEPQAGTAAHLWPTRLARLMTYATGVEYTPESLLEAGERVFNLERLFLLGAGFTAADDTLAPRMLQEPLTEGPAAGHVVELERMLPEFYRHRGWDEKGVPTPEKLAALRLHTQFER